jgi:hypothetical protein
MKYTKRRKTGYVRRTALPWMSCVMRRVLAAHVAHAVATN